jgi:putative MATE family efflux protein
MAFLGNYNIQYLSAVGNVLYPYTIMISFLTALSAGATVMISHNIGAKSLIAAKRYSEVSFFYNIAISTPFFLILFLMPQLLMTWMGASQQITEYSSLFMKSLSFSVLFIGVELSIAAILQGVGRTKAIMYTAIISTLANIFFDWVLIYGNLGFPELGIKGAAIATSLANFTGMVYMIVYFASTNKLPFKPGLRGIFKPRWKVQKENIRVGLPYGLEAMFWSFGQIIIIRMVNEIDDYSAGLYLLITRIQAVTFFIYLGIAKATMILVGQEIGSGNPKRATQIAYMSLKYSLILCVVASLTFISIPRQILSIFSNEENLISGAVVFLYIVAITIFPVTINVVIGNAIRGMKDTKWMFYTQSFGTTFTIVVSAIMLFVFHLNLTGVFITVLLDESIRAALNYRRFYSSIQYYK